MTYTSVKDRLAGLGLAHVAAASFMLLAGWWSWLPRNYWQRMLATEELLHLSRFLLACLKQGMPLQESVRSYGDGIRMVWLKKVFLAVASSLESGASFSYALESQAAFFPASFIAMVRAGEAQDDIPRSLETAARFLGAEAELKERSMAALTYPLVIASIIASVAVFMLLFVVPAFARLFAWNVTSASPSQLPLLTLFLFQLGHAVDAGLPSLCAAAVLIVLTVWLLKKKTGRPLIFLLPPLRSMRLNILEAHFCQSLGHLLAGGCSLEKALELAAGLDPDPGFRSAVEKTASEVKRGSSLSKALDKSAAFSKSLSWACMLGEERGDLPETLLWLGDHQALSIEYRQERLIPWLERSANILLGLLVGIYMVALLAPLFGMGAGASNLAR